MSRRGFAPIHPGEALLEEFLLPMGYRNTGSQMILTSRGGASVKLLKASVQ